MVSNVDEATLKSKVCELSDNVKVLTEKVNEVVTAQGKVDTSLKEMAAARRTAPIVSLMKPDIVEQTIKDNLNTQLVSSTVKVQVDTQPATIDLISRKKIESLVNATENLVESNKAIRPKKPLFTIYDGKKAIRIGVIIAVASIIGLGCTIHWANKKVSSVQKQGFYWANRAYQAALLRDIEHPGDTYHDIMSHFTDDPEKSKRIVGAMETNAQRYQGIKQYLISFIEKNDPRDIRVLAWEINNGEGWFLYRFYDEETKRSIHVWPDKKVEETTDKIVTDLKSAQKYSKRKIWTVIWEAPEAKTE